MKPGCRRRCNEAKTESAARSTRAPFSHTGTQQCTMRLQLRIKYHVIRASAETCYECLRGENKQKLEVLSFEKAWDKIEKDTSKLILIH